MICISRYVKSKTSLLKTKSQLHVPAALTLSWGCTFFPTHNCVQPEYVVICGRNMYLFVFGATGPPPQPQWARVSSLTRFLDHAQRRTTVSRTPLDEWSGHRRDLYLTTHNTHNRQTYVPPVGFEPTITTGERPQTHALDRAATGISKYLWSVFLKIRNRVWYLLMPWLPTGQK